MALSQTQVTLEHARRAARAGDVVQARNLLSHIIKANPRDEDAWLLFAQVAEKPEHARYCLDQILKLNPVNMAAVDALAALNTPPARPISPPVEPTRSGVEASALRPLNDVSRATTDPRPVSEEIETTSALRPASERSGVGTEAPLREQIIIEERMSGVLFLLPVLMALIGLSLSLFIAGLLGRGLEWVGLISAAAFVLSALLEALRLLGAFLSHRLTLTNKRILIKRGLLSRSTFEVLLTKVEGIGVRQPLLGRLLNFGTLVITGTGGAHQVFRGIREPQAIRHRLQAEVDRVQTRG